MLVILQLSYAGAGTGIAGTEADVGAGACAKGAAGAVANILDGIGGAPAVDDDNDDSDNDDGNYDKDDNDE